MRSFFPAVATLCLLGVRPAQAWFDGGHMVVAYVAYAKLTPQTRARVDGLLKLNKMYPSWTAGVADEQKGLAAFLRAATWADCIKQAACSPGYASDGGNIPTGAATDAQNIGYADTLQHRYWHFVNLPYSTGAPGQPPKVPNAQTEILSMAQAIGENKSDDVTSYDVVWLEHLIGDVHEPLHAVSRFTKNHPNGDAGGNLVYFCERPCRDELHAYWDGLLGDKPTIAEVTQMGESLLAVGKPAGADNADPASWISDSFELAKSVVYVSPIGDDNDASMKISPRPDAGYKARAEKVARSQGTLAGYRLAALLNKNLK